MTLEGLSRSSNSNSPSKGLRQRVQLSRFRQIRADSRTDQHSRRGRERVLARSRMSTTVMARSAPERQRGARPLDAEADHMSRVST